MVKQKPFVTVLIPSRTGVKVMEIKRKPAAAAGAVLLCALFVSFFGNFHLVKSAYGAFARWNAEEEHARFLEKIDALQNKTSRLDNELKKVFKANDQVRLMYDIPSVNDEERQLGIGGENIGDEAEKSIQRLERQMQFEKIDLVRTGNALATRLTSFAHMPAIPPVSGRVTSGFGVRMHPVLETTLFHEGIDIANHSGAIIYATADGIVAKIDYETYAGRLLQIDHGNNCKTYYAHLNRILVSPGQKVKRFQPIATVGTTGRTTGPHLHYEVRTREEPANPKDFMLPADMIVD